MLSILLSHARSYLFDTPSFIDYYTKVFEVLPVTNDARFFNAQKIYSHVYGADFKRRYNEHEYLLLHKQSNCYVGAVRIRLPDTPEDIYQATNGLCRDFPSYIRVALLSRLCLCPRFLQRPHDGKLLPEYSAVDYIRSSLGNEKPHPSALSIGRHIPYAPIGLLKISMEKAIQHGYSHFFWHAETDALPSLTQVGISFSPVGENFIYSRCQAVSMTPVLVDIPDTVENMASFNPACWEILESAPALKNLLKDSVQSFRVME